MRVLSGARLERVLCICVFVVGLAEEEQHDPCRIQGPTHKVLDRPEIQDGQSRKGGRAYLISGSRMFLVFFFVLIKAFFLLLFLPKSHIFQFSEAGEPQLPNPALLNSNTVSVASKHL